MAHASPARPWLHAAACGLLFSTTLLAVTSLAPLLEFWLVGGRLGNWGIGSYTSALWMPGWYAHAWIFYRPGIGYCGNCAPGNDLTWLTVTGGNLLTWMLPAMIVERLRVAWRAHRE
ncbi:MAG: hypothetical protein ACYTG2_03935 [Planctomycetota bacterium]|jgi:hypothetical protein